MNSMEEQVLNIEQMHNLKNLGIDTTCAKMFWCYPKHMSKKIYLRDYQYNINIEESYYPTFTVYDLIKLIPETININNENYELIIQKDGIKYCLEGKDIHEFKNILYYEYDEKLISAIYRMVIWLAENKLLTNN